MTPSWTVSAWDESDLVPEPETTGMQWVWGRREPNFPVRFSCSSLLSPGRFLQAVNLDLQQLEALPPGRRA